jgi:DNA-3-methyladenine glycosylase II
MKRLATRKPIGFSLRAAAEFYSCFTPASGMAAGTKEQLTLTFRLDGSFAPVAVTVREESRSLLVEVAGTDDLATLERQLARILGLDADSVAWFTLGETDLVVGELQRQFPGFLSAAQASPYDAATWAVIAHRMNQEQAARIRLALAREFGDTVESGDRIHCVFPGPAELAVLDRFPGLTQEKVARLRGVAQAALNGLLDAERLRRMGEARAVSELQSLRGIGPWAASHIYFRGAAPHDGLPLAEPRLLQGLASAYRLRSPSIETFQRVASGWRPFRTWVCVLLLRHLSQAAGWQAPGLALERAEVGRELARRAMPAA